MIIPPPNTEITLTMTPEGVKTTENDLKTNKSYINLHLDIGIESVIDLGKNDEFIKHFKY